MLKRLTGGCCALLFTLSCSTISSYTSPTLIAEQSIEIGSVEFKNFKKDTYVKIEELKETRNEKNITEEIIEEVEVAKMIVEEEYEVYPLYNPYNLLEPSNITREQMYNLLEGTALQSLSNGYVYMEEIYGINSLFLVSISAEESGWGTSSLAINNNNIGGIKLSDGGWAYFSDWFDCLNYEAELLYNEYLSENGSYFNGYSIWDVNIKYCEGNQWSENINLIAYELLNKIN